MPQSRSAKERLELVLEQLPRERVVFSAADRSCDLRGHSCVVTGGSSGLGEAFVEALAAAGAWVAVWDLVEERGQALARKLSDRGLLVKFFHTDVCQWQSQLNALKASIAASPTGRIDHFIANAGVGGHMLKSYIATAKAATPSLEAPDLSAINVSLIGSYYTMCLAMHHFTSSSTLRATSSFPAGRRSIILVGSMSSYRSMPIGTDYAAAKFGVRGLFTAARETMPLYRLDVRINMLAPQFIETRMNSHTRTVQEKAGYKFGDIKHAVTAMLRLVGDSSVKGRSIATNIEGPHDMNDDASGGDGWIQLQRLLNSDLLPAHSY